MKRAKSVNNFKLDLSLINVMYGVVFAYGFNFFDIAKTPFDYFRFFFAYAVLVIDWIYSHHTYSDEKYNRNVLVLDFAVLFSFSRLLNTSTADNPSYFFWLFIIFAIYLIWDRISQKDKVISGYSWKYCLIGDSIGAIGYLVFWKLFISNSFSPNTFVWSALSVIVYLLAFSFWFKKN